MTIQIIGQLPVEFLEEPEQPGQPDVQYPTNTPQGNPLGQQLLDQLLLLGTNEPLLPFIDKLVFTIPALVLLFFAVEIQTVFLVRLCSDNEGSELVNRTCSCVVFVWRP